MGGGDLVGQFHDQGLLDEVLIGFASVFLGAGAPLLPRRIVTPPLQLLEATAYGADFAILRYTVPKTKTLSGTSVAGGCWSPRIASSAPSPRRRSSG